MSKIIRRFLLDDSWSIGKNECWYTDMAAQGFHLKKIGRVCATFEKGEPKKIKYRIDVLGKGPTGEQLEVYKSCGWDFVTSTRDFSIFSSPEDSNSPELHTDPEEQGYTLLELDKRLKNNLFIISIAMLLLFGILFSIFFLEKRPYLSMIEGPLFQQILFSVIELYVFYTAIRNYIILHKLRKSLLEGKGINHREDWKKSRIIYGSFGILFMLIALMGVIIPWAEIVKRETYTLPESSIELPIIRLSEIEQSPQLKRLVKYNSRGVDWGNHVSYDWSLLAPVQYEVDEQGTVEGKMWEDNSGEYSPSISTQYYQLVFPQMAYGLIEDMMDKYSFITDTVPEKVENTKFDIMYIAADKFSKQVFASWGNRVVHITYYGNKDVEQVIALLADMASE